MPALFFQKGVLKMKKVVVVSDSFKGSIDSIEICHIAKEVINESFPECEIINLPVADGGEGTVECFRQAIGGELVETTVHGPHMELLDARYLRHGNTAIIEMAAAAGLPLVGTNRNPSVTTTYGVGEQIRHAVENGAKEILLGLGGSSTNDGACGLAAAIGVKFKDINGKEFVPTGGTLSKIEVIDMTEAKKLLEGVKVTAMCDIDSPMYGPKGAAYIFAPQKGADANMVLKLDEELKALDRIIVRELGIESVAEVPGAGAAGGMGGGVIAFMGAQLKPGIQAVLDTVEFEKQLEGADLVITGEGKLDSQSLTGKVVIGVSRRAKECGVPVVAVVGDVADDAYGAYDLGVSAIFSINRLAIPFSEAKPRSKKDYENTLRDIFRFVKAIGK